MRVSVNSTRVARKAGTAPNNTPVAKESTPANPKTRRSRENEGMTDAAFGRSGGALGFFGFQAHDISSEQSAAGDVQEEDAGVAEIRCGVDVGRDLLVEERLLPGLDHTG